MGISIVFYLSLPRSTPNADYTYSLENAFPNLSFDRPLYLNAPNDDSNRIFITEQVGQIYFISTDQETFQKTLFLDISSKVKYGGEQGLLGLAFHPDFKNNRYFYVDYTQADTGNTILSRFSVEIDNSNQANSSSEVVLLDIPQPYSNHNGGQIAFGPDGHLYIGLGDGGDAGDPFGNGQNRKTLLGSILRIDVDSGSPYGIPLDNPFYGNAQGYKEEIYAFGLRNPWRFSFDSETGTLWVADVGQGAWEELDIVENGKNYGWNTREGSHDYQPNTNSTPIVDPVYEYDHSLGRSVTGGYVYRGASLTGLVGKYIYGDYISGTIWALEYSNGVTQNSSALFESDLQIASFGVDNNQELYICAFDGNIYKIVASTQES